MTRLSFAALIVCSALPLLCCAQKIEGTLRSIVDGQPVPYALVMDLSPPGNATTTDTLGRFSLAVGGVVQGKQILISALAFRDTLVPVQYFSGKPGSEVLLEEQPVHLSEVRVGRGSGRGKSVRYGKTSYSLQRNTKGAITGYPAATSGFFNGVVIVPAKSHYGTLLTKLSVYITPERNPSNPFLVRFLSCTRPLEHSKGFPAEYFIDMCTTPIIFKADKPGWNTVNIRAENIRVPSNPFVVTLIPLGNTAPEGPHGVVPAQGAVLGQYDRLKVSNMFVALRLGYYYGIADAKSQKVPAIVLEGEKFKE